MKKYIIGLMAVASLASCSNDEIWTASVGGQSVINASFEGRTQSRVGFTDATPAVFFWNKGDEISVHTTSTSNPFITYTLTSGTGTGSAQFQGTLIGEGAKTSVCALYPANKDHKYDGGALTFHMADAYTYDYADDKLGLVNGGVSNSTNAPMLAKIVAEGNMDLNFKHLGGVFCFQIAKIPATATKFVFTANTKITGDFTVNMNGDVPSIATETAPTEEGKTVTINFTAGTEKRVFYIPVPTGTYTGFRWDMKDGGDQILAYFESEAENTVSRATLLRMPLLTCSTVTGGLTSSVQDVSALNTLLQNGATDGILPTSVAVTSAKDISSAIEIPAAYTSSSTGTDTPKVLNLTFNEVPKVASGSTDGAIEIKESSSGGTTPTESKASIEIAIPKVESGSEDNAPSFNIVLPSATVTLAAAEETTIYNKVVATTATNTLIVGKGVTVKELIVNGGNVRVHNGATVSAITRGTSNEATVTIYKEKQANLPDDLATKEGFTVVDAALADLQNVAENGGAYTLTKDLEGDFTISATAEVTINLDGYKITNKVGDTFTVNQGSKLTINGNGTVDNVTHQKACIYNNGTVVLNGGTYTRSKENGKNSADSGSNSYYNILNHGEMTINPGVKVSQDGHFSSMIANGYVTYNSGTPRSGYVSGTNHQNPSLLINGGTFSGGLNTIKNDDGAKLTIVDGTFTNMSQATVQNHHVTEIKGGTFNTSESAEYAVNNEGHNGEANDLGQMTISGGAFNGKIYVVGPGASLTITGGTFSDPIALAYLGDNANVTVKLNADTELAKSMVVGKGNATIDLNNHTLTATSAAMVEIAGKKEVVAIAVKDGAKATVKNGNIGSSTKDLPYGVYAFKTADVTLENVSFSEWVMYGYNGEGKLDATKCIFKGWLSGWHHGGTFTDCTFTIGKAWYPATICYGSTTFTNCKFLKNGVDADVYDNSGRPDADGYYRCNYVVAGCNPAMTIDFKTCKFIGENGVETTNVSVNDHPYHACGGWGDGKRPANAQIKVDDQEIQSQCSDKIKELNENK